MFKRILPLLLFAVIISCKNEKESVIRTTYLGGQVVNPILDYVIFSKGSEILDTIKLDADNFFHYRTHDVEEGLYLFYHGEGQVLYLQPGDSLLLHVNTMDFDESLAYSGQGGSQNNLLIDLYLKNEIENNNLSKWYSLAPVDFEQKIDSLREIKLKEFDVFRENHDVAKGFKEVVKTNITYDYYSKKEMYAAANRKDSRKLDDGFFDYRKEINFNKDEFRFYYPYYRFLNRYFENAVCSKYGDGMPIDRSSFEYNYRKIQLIDSLVDSDSIKNRLLRYNAIWYLINAKNPEKEAEIFGLFSKINTSKKNLAEVTAVYNISKNLAPGQAIPEVAVVNADNMVSTLKENITGPTVVYFWSIEPLGQIEKVHNRAGELKAKYPEYQFIGVNTDKNYKKWRQAIKKLNYDPAMEFQLENLSEAKNRLLLKYMSHVIIVDGNGRILFGKTNMFTTDFEENLLGFLNRESQIPSMGK